ncbi:MAG: sulfatase-like hydrolase/transferase, partial [Gemmataceae bacterium]
MLRWFGLILAGLMGSGALRATEPRPVAKNVVVLIADDLGHQLGCYGDLSARTPNLDKLAARGTRFAKAFASVASCSPSRATMLTGLPTHQSGQYGLAHATHHQHTFASVASLPKLLRSAGYRTGVVGKLHTLPAEVYAFEDVMADGGRNPATMTQKARNFIQKNPEKPFFLWMGYTDPHRAVVGFANDGKYPADVRREEFDPAKLTVPAYLPDHPEVRKELAEFYQSVARLDDGVGRLLELLKETGHAEDTLV